MRVLPMNHLKRTCEYSVVVLIFITLVSCASQKERHLRKNISKVLELGHFEDHFTGIMLFDPVSNDTLLALNSDRYFTPASNTKIFTLYSALKILPEQLPALSYVIQNDTLYFQGTGDAAALHPFFKDSTAALFLKRYPNIAYVPGNFQDDKFGPGWAWEDYDSPFAPERSGFPMYGNVVQLIQNDSLSITPSFFRDSIFPTSDGRTRKEEENIFFYKPGEHDTLLIPFKAGEHTTKDLLTALLGIDVRMAGNMPAGDRQFLYGISADTVYQRMMQESDNFLAEQLLLQASSVLGDTLSGVLVREFVLDTYLANLRHQPRWVDGSGLSRYNLFTPESMVYVLNALYREIDRERLFSFFPKGGESGTLKDWFRGAPHPYVIAKSGTLGNNYSLSGYLLTKSGKTLIFSFMNNHFMEASSEVKKRMQPVLETIRDSY